MPPINKKRMRIIRQKQDADCGICCLAMLTGIRHRDVINKVGNCWHPEKGMLDAREDLVRLGFMDYKSYRIIGSVGRRLEYRDFKASFCHYSISAEYYRDQVWGRRALLSVPSLNNPGGMHMVYWHYDRLYDPSTKNRYTKFEDLKPNSMVIFNERIV